MLLDHLGYEVFPQILWLRIIGRIAFPIFSYSIYEGCKYSGNHLRYFSQVLSLGLLCVLVYYLHAGKLFGNILITFSLSIICCTVLFFSVRRMETEKNRRVKTECAALLLLTVFGIFLLSRAMEIDYGFWGILCPAWAAALDLFSERLKLQSASVKKYFPVLGFSVGLVILAAVTGENQWYSLLAIVLLFLYNGKKGRYPMKYFFYVFYPLHLAVVGLISDLI